MILIDCDKLYTYIVIFTAAVSVRAVLSPRGHLAMFGVTTTRLLPSTVGRNQDAAKHDKTLESHTQQRVTQPETSIMLRLRNPVLEQPYKKVHTDISQKYCR